MGEPLQEETSSRLHDFVYCALGHECWEWALWYITRRFEHFLHESSNVSLNLRTEGVSTTANCGLLASLCSGSSSVRYLVETEYISLPDAKHSGLAHFSFEHSGKYLHLNVRTKTRFS